MGKTMEWKCVMPLFWHRVLVCPTSVPNSGMASAKDAVAAALAAAKSRSNRASALSASPTSTPKGLAKPGSKFSAGPRAGIG